MHIPVAKRGQLLLPGETITSPETGLGYTVEHLIGEGGFGQAYLARREGKSPVVPDGVCIKVSPHIDGMVA